MIICIKYLAQRKRKAVSENLKLAWLYLWVRKIPWRRTWQPTPASCLENPMERGAWQATVHGVTKSWTQLKQLSMHALLITYYMLQVYNTVIHTF